MVEQILPELIPGTKWPTDVGQCNTTGRYELAWNYIIQGGYLQKDCAYENTWTASLKLLYKYVPWTWNPFKCKPRLPQKSGMSWCLCYFKVIFFTFYHSKSPLNHHLGIFFSRHRRGKSEDVSTPFRCPNLDKVLAPESTKRLPGVFTTTGTERKQRNRSGIQYETSQWGFVFSPYFVE